MQAGLIPLIIQFFDSGKAINFFPSPKQGFPGFDKRVFQSFVEKINTHEFCQTLDVMGNIPGILCGIAFLESFPAF